MILVHVAPQRNTRHAMVALLNKAIKVSVAIITDSCDQILITQRAAHISHGGYWEFPGGKVELNEPPEIALLREVNEEVGLDVLSYRYLGEVQHQYDDYQVILFGYHVNHYRGKASCRETQTGLQWVNFLELGDYNFPLANKKLIQLFSLG